MSPAPSASVCARGGRNRAASLFGLTVAWTAIAGCRVDHKEFDNRVFACDVAAPDPGCGMDETGRAMSCFAARQIGATDFCARTCDQASSSTDDSICLSSRISLASCRPSDDQDKVGHPLGACDTKALACYRTDLLSDEGVCTTMSPCNADLDCRDPVRSVCVTSFLAGLYSHGTSALHRDHLFCMQTGCKARGTSCSPGESCLQEVVAADANPPDVCVPNCDSHLNCPPNFLCYKKVSTSIAPNVCIPGLLGFTCNDSIDCMVGTCVDTLIGYKLCSTTCNSDAECQQFDGEQGKFVCLKNPGNPTQPGYCHTPDAYRGAICDVTSECVPRNPAEVCSRFAPTDAAGTCLLPCSPEGDCAPRVGINHTCLPSFQEGAPGKVCFPGYFGLPCSTAGNCVGGMACRPTGSSGPSICTQTCASTADCLSNRWIAGDAWCEPQLQLCIPKLADGEDCLLDESCKSGKCSASHLCFGSAGAG